MLPGTRNTKPKTEIVTEVKEIEGILFFKIPGSSKMDPGPALKAY